MSKTKKNPFVGLRPFDVDDSLYYFGRDEQVKALLRQLHKNRFLAVVGSSGSGKSSLIRAGLIPNLQAGFLVQERDLWHIAVMKPGDAPLSNLAKAILTGTKQDSRDEDIADFVVEMKRYGAQAIINRIKPTLDKSDANLLLLIDQFEELFRFVDDQKTQAAEEEAADFVNVMLGLAGQTEAPIFVCKTMRSDFLGDCDRFYGLPEAMNRSQYLVPRLTRQQRREAINGPIRLSGAKITPRLLDRVLNENLDTRDDLPVLQHALMRTWSAWSENGKGDIDVEHYEKIETMQKALHVHAEEAYNELSKKQKRISKRLFQTITETDSGNRRIRRPAYLSRIAAIATVDAEEVMQVIQKFRENHRNFLVLSSENVSDDPLIDISHESFIRQWRRLDKWVGKEADSAKVYQRLAQTAELYQNKKAGLYSGADLQFALSWKEENKPNAYWATRYHENFIETLAFLKKSQQNAQRKQWFSIVSIIGFFAFAIFLAVLWSLLGLARKNELQANYNLAKFYEEKTATALKNALETNSTAERQRTFMYAREILKLENPKDPHPLNAGLVGDLLNPFYLRTPFTQRWFSPNAAMHSSSVYSVAFSGDGKTLASGSEDRTIRLWDVATGAEKAKLEGHTRTVYSVAFSGDGKTLASGSADNTIRLWDVATGAEKTKLEGHTSTVWSVAFSGDGKTLASGSSDRTIRLWDIRPFKLFLGNAQATALFKKLTQGGMFFWQVEKDGLAFKHANSKRSLYPINGYHFVHEQAYRTLLDPPAQGQSKYDQILAWAQRQLAQEKSLTNK